ncbi:MAG: hypothetical protein JNK33_03210 [Candidatus Doudnabacteria bacterium]|nr:hypothetical protein [Candidatus Doudnabacteria bacterium]
MKTVEDIVKLCQDEQGKVFIMDATGDVKLVLMGVGEYERLKSTGTRDTRLDSGVDPRRKGQETSFEAKPGVDAPMSGLDAEAANREILIAQLREQAANFVPAQTVPRVEVNPLARQDLREEVIDPSFNFDGPDNSF